MNRTPSIENGGAGGPVQAREVLLTVVVVERRDDVAPSPVRADGGEHGSGVTTVALLDDQVGGGGHQGVRTDDRSRSVTVRDIRGWLRGYDRRCRRRLGWWGRACFDSSPLRGDHDRHGEQRGRTRLPRGQSDALANRTCRGAGEGRTPIDREEFSERFPASRGRAGRSGCARTPPRTRYADSPEQGAGHSRARRP